MRDRSQTLRKKALKRDNFTCQKCKLQDKTGKLLEAHHISPLYLEKNDTLDNLITLCYDCHKYAPDKKEDFDKYIEDECEGTMTTLIKTWNKVRKEHPELFEQVNKEQKINNTKKIIKKELIEDHKMLSRQINPQTLKQQILKRDNFTCQKCGFSGLSDELNIHNINFGEHKNEPDNLITLCSICSYYAPKDNEEFKIYLNEKIDGKILDTFRKSQKNILKRTKRGMVSKFEKGNVITRAPLGYKVENKQLIPGEHSYVVSEIYNEFLHNNISLTQLAKKYALSVNGLKKVLSNYTYLGKVKFDGQIIQGKHQPLISSTLFNQVQEKLKKVLRGSKEK
jgi:5-methylcytosine-specific restriction endonuclease McrA